MFCTCAGVNRDGSSNHSADEMRAADGAASTSGQCNSNGAPKQTPQAVNKAESMIEQVLHGLNSCMGRKRTLIIACVSWRPSKVKIFFKIGPESISEVLLVRTGLGVGGRAREGDPAEAEREGCWQNRGVGRAEQRLPQKLALPVVQRHASYGMQGSVKHVAFSS